jgi:uncharacterized protein (UPF0261 family)
MTGVVLIVGTADTKSDEIAFLRQQVQALGAQALVMDVGVLAAGHGAVDIANAAVAAAAGTTLPAVIDSGDESTAMTWMARGAAALAARLHAEGRIHGLLALGGSMGTDLAFDVAAALPLGCPKVVVSTIAHSHLIPPERITPDLIMVLWAGGLYGLNSLCRSALAQGAGAVVGAINAAQLPQRTRPLVGMTSLGKSCLSYMVELKPALEARGYEVAVFHTTGMGGRAFESLAAAGAFCAVMDFSLQELANHLGGSVVTSGPDRLTGAGRSGTPQIVAPGAVDMVDFPAWQPVPAALAGRGPFDPEHDAPWRDMQADRISERDYWLLRTREVGRLLGEDWDRMETFVKRARGADPSAVIRPEAVAAIELDLFYGADFRQRLPLLARFDLIVDASHTGILKPDPRAYAAVTAGLGVAAADCVFVDDQRRNVDGARRAGMQAVHFDVRRPGESYRQALALLGVASA